ncbi:adenylosuccinate synthetase [Formosa sp. 3Alg 14/1]|uniref:adenylosuccinate synthetase n=1 Tax=unclassified Formosa TaxID=2644710 RepID=UPI0039BEAD66
MIHKTLALFAQLPLGTPNPDDNQPVDFSDPFNIVVFIILPIIAIILYVYWRKQQHKK